MANYDKPAFTFPALSKDVDADGLAGDFKMVPVTDAGVLAEWAAYKNAMTDITGTPGGGGGGPQSYPISG